MIVKYRNKFTGEDWTPWVQADCNRIFNLEIYELMMKGWDFIELSQDGHRQQIELVSEF